MNAAHPSAAAAPYDARERILPELVAHEPALANNERVLAAFVREAGLVHAPHAKTHMSPELVARQMSGHGPDTAVWGFTVATPRQAMTLAAWGVPRILHANLLVDPAAIAWVAETFLADAAAPMRYVCQADSLEAVALLDAELARARPARRLDVLVEMGFPGGRTGARTVDAALEVGWAIARTETLRWAGVTAFEGLMPTGVDPDGFPRGAVALLAGLRELVARGRADGSLGVAPIVSAGGSSYPDLIAAELGTRRPDGGARWGEPVTVVLRSGCAHIHDHGVYERTSPFGAARGDDTLLPALELRARVLSAPEPGRVILGFGRREAPTDDRFPVVLGVLGEPGADVSGWVVEAVNDHHAFVAVPTGSVPAPGTVIRLGVSHPCGAFDRWRTIPVLDAGGAVIGRLTTDL
ncbi:amino acid deaminase [Microbacterium sp. Marseille-Q6965]|uniref:amino acid deaminase n=1 Tax=Microbacterium sp. Marseille-Q6965 TaxID=2965072 RepID=UPI0021B74642|nr:amino acid deaminase [Microbacterium sp. Marseille-Q6965]